MDVRHHGTPTTMPGGVAPDREVGNILGSPLNGLACLSGTRSRSPATCGSPRRKYDGYRGLLYVSRQACYFRSKRGNILKRFEQLCYCVPREAARPGGNPTYSPAQCLHDHAALNRHLLRV
jgi:hypothetical protein